MRFSAKPDESEYLRKAILQRNAITTKLVLQALSAGAEDAQAAKARAQRLLEQASGPASEAVSRSPS